MWQWWTLLTVELKSSRVLKTKRFFEQKHVLMSCINVSKLTFYLLLTFRILLENNDFKGILWVSPGLEGNLTCLLSVERNQNMQTSHRQVQTGCQTQNLLTVRHRCHIYCSFMCNLWADLQRINLSRPQEPLSTMDDFGSTVQCPN